MGRNQKRASATSNSYRNGARRPMRPGETPALLTTEWLTVSTLKVDPKYQRDISKYRVAEIVEQFDPDLLGTFLVSRRGTGAEYLLDGQTRQQALIEMGWSDQRVPCLVYAGLKREDEARIFVGANVTRTKPTGAAIFKGKLAANDADTIEIHDIAVKHGYLNDQVMRTSFKSGTITSPTALVFVHHHGGAALLDRLLAVTSSAWPKQHLPSPLLKALGVFLAQYATGIDMARLVQSLAKTAPDLIVSRARALAAAAGSGHVGYSPLVQVVIADYNRGLRNGRLIWTEVTGTNTWQQRAIMFVGETPAVRSA